MTILVQYVIPGAEDYKARSTTSLRDAGILDALEAQLTELNPDWAQHSPQTYVLKSVRTTDTLVFMRADCDPAPRPIEGHHRPAIGDGQP